MFSPKCDVARPHVVISIGRLNVRRTEAHIQGLNVRRTDLPGERVNVRRTDPPIP